MLPFASYFSYVVIYPISFYGQWTHREMRKEKEQGVKKDKVSK